MARRRNRKGQFVKSGGRRSKRRGSRKRRRGVGSIITLRKRRGVGQVDMNDLLPPLVGGGLAALTTLSLRHFVQPNGDPTKTNLVKYAPLLGIAGGSLGALALYMMQGMDAAVRSFLSAGIVGGFAFGSDLVMQGPNGPQVAAALVGPSPITSTAGNGTAGYLRGVGAIVPEYGTPTGAIVMEPVGRGSGNRRPGTIGSYGETVNLGSLGGVNTGAFGTPGFTS